MCQPLTVYSTGTVHVWENLLVYTVELSPATCSTINTIHILLQGDGAIKYSIQPIGYYFSVEHILLFP